MQRERIIFLFLKRFLDKVLSILLIILLLPAALIIALLIKLDSRGPVFYTQTRAGLYGRPFKIYKFRSMVQSAEKLGGYYTSSSDRRITKMGKWLRAWSIDELPQLINILKGDMSFIGPRPTLMHHLDEYTGEQKKRLLMKPGVTGLAQVSGRNELSWPERIELDIKYINNWSIYLDAKILVKTFKVILKKEGIYAGKEKFIINKEKTGS